MQPDDPFPMDDKIKEGLIHLYTSAVSSFHFFKCLSLSWSTYLSHFISSISSVSFTLWFCLHHLWLVCLVFLYPSLKAPPLSVSLILLLVWCQRVPIISTFSLMSVWMSRMLVSLLFRLIQPTTVTTYLSVPELNQPLLELHSFLFSFVLFSIIFCIYLQNHQNYSPLSHFF